MHTASSMHKDKCSVPDSCDFLLDMPVKVHVVQHNLMGCSISVRQVTLLLLSGLQTKAYTRGDSHDVNRVLRVHLIYPTTCALQQKLTLTGIATALFKNENGIGGSSPC